MPNPFRSSGACPDRLVLQRSCDGDLSPAEAARVAGHVEACAACRTACDRLDADRALVTIALGEEDEANEAQARDTLEFVRRRLAEATEMRDRRAPATTTWPTTVRTRLFALAAGPAARRAALATAALAVVAVVTGVVWNRVTVSASAERVLTEARVRNRAWRFEAGKVREQTVAHTRRERGRAEQRAVRTLWFCTVAGQESYTGREYDAAGAVVAAWWTRTDGWSARFVASDGNLLTLDPPMADLKRLTTTLPPEDERALSSWIQSQEWQVRPQRQVAALAAAAGEAGTFAPPTGERQGRPQLVREGGSYRITYRVAPPFAAFANLTFVIEDTLAVADLAFERRFTRTVDPAGVVLDEAEHRLISRKEADPAVFAKLMAEVDAPPAHWRVKRLTPAEVAATVVARWNALRPH